LQKNDCCDVTILIFPITHIKSKVFKHLPPIPIMLIQKNFMYDKNLDRLMIFNNIREDEKIYGSVKILNLILDITTKNRIANIEIRNISNYLNSLEKNPEILETLKDIKINTHQLRGGFVIQINLIGENNTEKIPYTIPTQEQILITA